MQINFKKTEMIRAVIEDIKKTFEACKDTIEFMPEKAREEIDKNIMKTLKTSFDQIDREDKYYQKRYKKYYKKIQREKIDNEIKISLGIKDKIKEQKNDK